MSFFSDFGNALFGVGDVSSAPYRDSAASADANAQKYAGREQGDYANQTRTADNLWGAVNGTVPSVAQLQLGQALDQNMRAGLAAGAGSNGASSVLARYLAAQQAGAQGAQYAQSAALLRAQEQAQERQQLAQIYAQQAAESAGLQNSNASMGYDYAHLAQANDQANAARRQQAEAAGLSLLTGAGSMLFGRAPVSGGAAAPAAAGGVPDSLLGSSNPAVSNAAWGAYGG